MSMESWIPYAMVFIAALGIWIQWKNRQRVTDKDAQEFMARRVVELLQESPVPPFYLNSDGELLEARVTNLELDHREQKRVAENQRREFSEEIRGVHQRIDHIKAR